MVTLLKSILLLATVCSGTVCAAEWEITEIRTASYERESYSGPPEMRMDLAIRNASGRMTLVWGQDFGTNQPFYLIESFIRGKDDAVWERQNMGMCGAVGKIGWIEVQPGETIRSGRILFREYAGRQMLLTVRRAFSKGDAKGAEILLGPFTIPKPEKSEQPAAAHGEDTAAEPQR